MLDLTIAGARVRVPEYGSQAETKRLAAMVTNRIKEIERESGTVDSHAFALQAALSFAAELHDAQDQHKEDSKQILLALDAISTQLASLVEQFHSDID